MIAAPTPVPTPTSTLFNRSDIGSAAATASSLNLDFLGKFLIGVVMVCMIWYGISLITRPRKTSLAEAGKSSGVMGIGMSWIGGAMFVGAGALLGLFGGFFDALIR